MDPKDPKGPSGEGGDVIPIDEARKKAEAGDQGEGEARTVTVDGAEFLKPVMAAIAKELAGVADPDGVVRVGGADEASRAKTAAVVKGLGVGLGQALAQAFGKWAEKIQTGQAEPPNVTGTIQTDPPKKPS